MAGIAGKLDWLGRLADQLATWQAGWLSHHGLSWWRCGSGDAVGCELGYRVGQ